MGLHPQWSFIDILFTAVSAAQKQDLMPQNISQTARQYWAAMLGEGVKLNQGSRKMCM